MRSYFAFFGMNERPSRKCLLQSGSRAQELQAKDVAIVAVQVSKTDENDLKKRLKEYDIFFAVGMARGEEEKTRFTPGVTSLPWLILTDKKYTVVAEGFAVRELDENMVREAAKKQN